MDVLRFFVSSSHYSLSLHDEPRAVQRTIPGCLEPADHLLTLCLLYDSLTLGSLCCRHLLLRLQTQQLASMKTK